jgi:hypothetical protein
MAISDWAVGGSWVSRGSARYAWLWWDGQAVGRGRVLDSKVVCGSRRTPGRHWSF